MTLETDVSAMKTEMSEIKRILIGNGTKGMIRKMEEVCASVIKMQEADKIKSKIESKFDKWSRTKMILVFGLIQAIFIIFITFIIKKLGG